ncbi:beta-ketoacyl synthase N-terminal-like domain-containing protein, partial [Streptomyces celluloflavus]
MADDKQLVGALKKLAADLFESREQIKELESGAREPVAIVGMGCRYPGGVTGPESFWDLLTAGTDAVGGFPTDRGWDAFEAEYGSAGPSSGEAYARQGAFVYDAADFDASFFGISPREALAMDPQQRLLLETAWEAIEHAALDPAGLQGSNTGVYVGANNSSYSTGLMGKDSSLDGYLLTGNVTAVASGRISYVLGLTGPAVTVDTACSSSLVALHQAVQALRAGECSMALAGGVAVMVTPGAFMEFSQQGGMAASGRCKAFSAEADGIGWGEGAGMLVLERLSDARRNGHQVLAVIRGTAANQDGASNGLTAPNGPSQRRVIRAALANAQLSAAEVDAVEAHGTGTTLGDPIEAGALLATYGQAEERSADRPLWLGSVKSNIGHAQCAGGVAGVIKMVLALRHGLLPKSLYAQEPTPHVDWSAGNVKLLQEPVEWAAGEQARRAGVSAFGVSGTNVHVILEEAPRNAPDEAKAPENVTPVLAPEVPVWVLAGRSAAGLAAQAGRLREHVLARPEAAPRDIAWSLATTRTAFEHRAVVLGAGREELTAGLAAVAMAQPAANVVTGTVPPSGAGRAVFVFPGQGSQWVGMGRELAEVSPVFAARLAECAAALEPYVDWELEDVLAGRHGFEAADVVQPALWAVMVSLAAVWQAAGVQPDAVVGHSQGEIAAAAVAGVLSLDDAAKVVALRSKTLTALAGRGGMMSVAEAADVVRERIAPFGERLSLAAVNGSSATVVSGEPEALRELADSCPESVRTRIIPVDYASHSAQVDDLREEILSVLDGIKPSEATIPMISAMSGEMVTGPELDPAYWYASLRETVEFDGAVRVLAEKGHGTYIEVSPHPVLTTAIADSLEERSPVAVGTLRREDGGAERLLTSFAEAHTGGVVVDWAAVLGGSGVTIDLPTYAFQRRRFWPEALSSKPVGAAAGADDWRYRITWQPQADGVATLSGRWLVIGETPERDDIAGALMDRGAEVVVVTDPAGVGQVDAAGVAGVLSLLAFDESADAEYPWVPRGTAATLALVQELGRSGIDAPLWIVTRGAVETGAGEATTNPAQAQVWGLGRAVGLEHPDRWGGLIDLPPVFDARVGARLVAVLADGREDQVALRPSGVLLRRLVRAEARGPKARVWSPRGTVLLTGGTGSIGTVVAPWLAEQGVPRVMLTSRSGPSAPGVAALAAEVAAGGSAVEVLCCDTGARDQVAGIVAHVERSGPGLATVLHSANTPFLSRVEDTAPDGLALALSAKAAGASYLDEATADLDLDAFVMFSSISATWGSNDHGAYAAGNSYLDALAEDRRARGLPGTSIAWGVWNTRDWDAVDALMDHSPGRVTPHRLLRQGMNFLDTGRALETLGQILADDETFIAVANVEWEKFAPVFCAARPRPLLDTIPQVEAMRAADAAAAGAGQAATGSGQAEPANELAGQLAGLGAAKRQKAVEELVRSHAAAVLGHESAADVPSQLAFREVGFDSLTAVELRTRLNGATGVRLPATVVFDHPNPVALAEEIVRRLFGAEDVAAAPVASAANASEPLAIVGMACRYPGGVRTPDELWQLLASGGDAISGFPADRGWDVEGLFDADPDNPGTSYASEGGFLSGAADFDADFFGISPREALAMDPQQRLLLEICWEAIERAGIDPRSLSGSATGVFAGVAPSGYATVGGDMHGAEGHLITGNAMSVLSGRVSYTLGLNGPALTVDTACSSSLVAIHLAGQALRSGECSMALAGGVTVMADPGEFIGFSRQRALAADGRCKAFADGADGMGMAEGAGMVVLERLSDARRLGHPVLGVIRGTAVNQDGASNGLTAPNGPAQQRVIRAALADARLVAGDVDAVEAHGTGTELGDPIEAGALLATYGQERDGQQPLWLGSLKSNIGHSQQAAGVGGVIKMVLALQHGLLPRTLHAESPSPHVDWSAGHIELLQEAREWAAGERPRRAGVSAFGISGTNAHVIVEEAPDAEVASEEATGGSVVGRSVWLVSGRSVVARAEQAGRLRGFVAGRPGLSVGDVGWSLAVGRSGFEERAVVVGGSREELLAGLGVVAAGESGPGVVVGSVRGRCRVGFLFAGQGSQRVGMGRELYGSNAVFAGAFDEVCGLIEAELGIDLAGVVLGEEGVGVGVGGVGVDSTLFAQTGLFAVEVALVAMLRSFGVVPDVVAGHSVGEVAAAFVAGVLSLGDAVRLVSHRARLMEGLPGGGAMAAVEASEEEIGVEVGGVGLSLAAVNGPRSVVVSGDVGVVDA